MHIAPQATIISERSMAADEAQSDKMSTNFNNKNSIIESAVESGSDSPNCIKNE